VCSNHTRIAKKINIIILTTKLCDKCNKQITSNNYNKHYNSCVNKKEHSKINEEWKLENSNYKCPFCEKEYSKLGILIHIWRNHTEDGIKFSTNEGYKNGRTAWNKGLTKETNENVRKNGESLSNNIKNGKTIPYWKDKHISEETKQVISDKMKLAHKEGRAWNIGKSRWNNKKSYPEIFFEKVINNEFLDKYYKTEYNIGIYSLDFAWIHKKKVIEIDGEQHERFEEYRLRDIKKDEFLISNGWTILRIKWKDMYNNTKEKIQEAKNFIDN
jgi:very-short-patch-repair endonuclease